jgi:hypothetical protein
LGDILRHSAEMAGSETAAVFDLTASFYQWELPPHLQAKFAFRWNGETFCMNRLPMGFKLAPAFMEAVVNCLLPDLPPGVKVGTHIDNVRFMGEASAVKKAADEFQTRCHAVGVTLNPIDPYPHHQGEWLGTWADYTKGTVTLGKKIRAKLEVWQSANLSSLSINDMESLHGLLLYCTRVMRLDVAPYYGAIKCLRRKLSASRLLDPVARANTPANIWPATFPIWRSWISTLLAAPPVAHRQLDGTTPLTLFVDASTRGYGAVLCDNTGYRTISGKWDTHIPSDAINEHELLVVGLALEGFDLPEDADLHIVIDNTSAIAALRRSLVKDEILSNLASEIRKKLPNRKVAVSHISTSLNPSDEVSRGNPVVHDKVVHALGAVGKVEARLRHQVLRPRRDFIPNRNELSA